MREVFYLMFSLSFLLHRYIANAVSMSEIKTSMDRFACQKLCGLLWFKFVLLLNLLGEMGKIGDAGKSKSIVVTNLFFFLSKKIK